MWQIFSSSSCKWLQWFWAIWYKSLTQIKAILGRSPLQSPPFWGDDLAPTGRYKLPRKPISWQFPVPYLYIWNQTPNCQYIRKRSTPGSMGIENWKMRDTGIPFNFQVLQFPFPHRCACHKVTGWMEMINLGGPEGIPSWQTKQNPVFLCLKTECFDETTSVKLVWLTKITKTPLVSGWNKNQLPNYKVI